MLLTVGIIPLFFLFTSTRATFTADRLHVNGAQSINLWKLRSRTARTRTPLLVQDDPGSSASTVSSVAYFSSAAASFPEYTFTQPLDHFYNTTNGTFGQRYWVSTRHYKSGTGAPVIVLDGGETSGEDRLPYLDTGIVNILAKATGGVGVVLEHRYYGESVGVANFSTDNLRKDRWLNNEQALEDSANFMRNVRFEGIDEDLMAPNVPWIYYGGSYAGARVAHMKILYPDIVFGAIASSGVTHAAITNWEYMDVIRIYADPKCSANLVRSVALIDTLLKVPVVRTYLKGLFGLGNLTHDVDFVSLITVAFHFSSGKGHGPDGDEDVQDPLGSWQSKNWDPAVGSTVFDKFCDALNGNSTGTAADTNVTTADGLTVNLAVLNYANYIKENIASACPNGTTLDDCFGTFNDSAYQDVDLSQDWRLWTFQYCTQWGYLTTAPPSRRIPTIISHLLDLDYEHKICLQAFPPGEFFTVPALPNVTAVNVLGDFAIAADRLAIVDGEIDPWRPDTPHSQYGAKERADTILRPFKLIPGAVHHWDENGLADNSAEPVEIRAIHEQEVEFVTAWLKDFRKPAVAA
ncbi:hypothetical protein EW146_g8421 [Bondarzewia mesenterica]|uniref:Peptidase S28 n=1 Tax=Bondarzewia mesenterica TaxID=1095465 RepID=A0A4S4LEI6_9AGAM|nr:hypothetical protein EW146_g8421 [Bondarzewia mesenterica]